MHDKRHRIRSFLIQPFLWLRICCIAAALLGSQYFVLASLAAVEGHIHTPPGGKRVQAQLPARHDAWAMVGKGVAHVKTTVPTIRAGKGNVYQHTQSRGTLVPDLAINIQTDATSYLPGATVNYTLTVSNSPGAGVVSTADPLIVTDLVPLGLSNITLTTANVQSWKFTITNTISPSLITATYAGGLPIAPGTIMPTIHIAGTVMPQAGPSLINVGSVNVTDDPISNNNLAIVDVTILAAGPTPLPTFAVTQTPAVSLVLTPTPTPTATATATSVPTPTPTATAAPTPTAVISLTPTVTTALSPALVTTQATSGEKYFTVGQQVQYVILVRNLPVAGAELLPITLTDFVRPGLAQLIPTGSNWNFSVSAKNSPATIFARYTGAYPVMSGQVLPPIMLTGVLMPEAVPELTNTAVVTSSDDPGISNVDTTSATIFVTPIPPTAEGGSVVPTPTMSTVGSPTPVIPPNLAIATIHLNGDNYRVGDQISTVLIIHNLAQAGPIVFPNPVSVTYILPVGATAIAAHGLGWTFVLSSTTSPAVISAFYSGHFPIGTGDALPAITLTATLTAEAMPSLTGTAIVDTPGNVSTSRLFTDTLFVSKQRVSCPGTDCTSGNPGTGQTATPTPANSGGDNSGNSGSGNSGSNGSGNNGSNGPGQVGPGALPHSNLPNLPGTGSDPNL